MPNITHQRRLIANHAARLIAEGLTDYHAAKLKAAKQLGLTRRHDEKSLPDNHEIDLALREHLALFAADTQPQALAVLRDAALAAMRWLTAFDPWLIGAVLNGTATEMSAIELELVGVDTKTFEMFLLNENIAFDLRVPTHKSSHTRVQDFVTFEFSWRDWPIEVSLFASHAARGEARPRASVKHPRARLAEAQTLFAATTTKT
jgi:hypothetical protein